PGCVTVANDTVTGCGRFSLSVAVTASFGVTTTPPIAGITVTDEVAVPTLPRASRKPNVTAVVPTGSSVSTAMSTRRPSIVACVAWRTGAASPLSLAEPPVTNPRRRSDAGAPVMLPRAPSACVAATVIAAGAVTTGAIVSTTATVNAAEPWLPCASVAVQLTVVGPNANVDPLAGVHTVAIAPSSTSVAEAVKVYTAPAAL